jgi:hypothetical protein
MTALGFRPLNVALRAGSPALRAYAASAAISAGDLAPGFHPRPDLNLTNRGGRTITDLVFVNSYLGGGAAWNDSDRTSIDTGLSAVMTDPGMQKVLQQYFKNPISSTMLPSHFVDGPVGPRFFKDDAEKAVTTLFQAGAMGQHDPANAVICLMLPRGVVLVDGNSDGSDAEAPHARAVLVDDEQADSLQGLGGYHGSVHVGVTTVYYAVGVYSEGNNGIVAFDKPWKNVVATFSHELSEARTDPDVEDVIRTGNAHLLGWYSRRGGEIGDIPMALAGANLALVMKEITLADHSTQPAQLEWSNRVNGPEAPPQP